MLLENKVAVIYGAGGAIGGAVARVFASEGAKVFLAGRTLAKLEVVAHDISSRGGSVEATQVDALDERAVEGHARCGGSEGGRHRHRIECRRLRSRPGHTARGTVAGGLRASGHRLHTDQFHHREGRGPAHGQERLRPSSSCSRRRCRACRGPGTWGTASPVRGSKP